MKKILEKIFYLVWFFVICFIAVGEGQNSNATGLTQDRLTVVKKQFKKIIASVDDSNRQQGEKLTLKQKTPKLDLDEVHPVSVRGQFSDKKGGMVEYFVVFHEEAEKVDDLYLGSITYAIPTGRKEIKSLGDKATEISFPDGTKRIVFKKGRYVVSLGFPPSSFALSGELAGNFISAIENAEKP
jgi:hypothetical protein